VVNSISRRKSRIVRALVTPTARLILLAGNCLNRTELTHTVAVCEATLVWSSTVGVCACRSTARRIIFTIPVHAGLGRRLRVY